jgi:DNA modification methylase
MTARIINADVIDGLRSLESESVQCCITSPPYWGLRDYGVEGQIGLERTPEEYVAHLVEVFREVRRVLRNDGTLWLNLGDSYNGSGGAGGDYAPGGLEAGQPKYPGRRISTLKPKDLVGIPWRVAFALQEDGWYLRSDIIWHKPNAMPESVRSRPTKAHEYVFLLAKSPRYFYDADAVREESHYRAPKGSGAGRGRYSDDGMGSVPSGGVSANPLGRNRRDVWTIPTRPYKGAHFATFPPPLPRRAVPPRRDEREGVLPGLRCAVGARDVAHQIPSHRTDGQSKPAWAPAVPSRDRHRADHWLASGVRLRHRSRALHRPGSVRRERHGRGGGGGS